VWPGADPSSTDPGVAGYPWDPSGLTEVPSDPVPLGSMQGGVPGVVALPGAGALASLNPGRRAVKALAAVAVAVALIAGFVVWRSQPHAEMVSASTSAPTSTVSSGNAGGVTPGGVPAATGAPPPASSPASGSMIVVAISGRVRRPGLVRLPADSRVADAIAAAGGALPGTDLSFVNLARKVSDGELIVIGITPSPGQTIDSGAADPTSTGGTAGALVNVNTATEAQLETLPGIGPALAQRIIDYRTQHGAFRSISQLQQVPGIGDAKFADIKDLVTV
jgi:competence protein ComEA